ncbi:blue copper protein-like [Rutidosis leptorrhynchoides]|uniref:blue copper protein-like n=1 Tax=Rutidosis leptorrhynchoides TaxID=125765 RepID=UPI003A9A4037
MDKKCSIFIILVATILVVDTSAQKPPTNTYELNWVPDFDYKGWAEAKNFVEGDKIIFKYEVGKYSVLETDQKGYDNCFVCPTATPHSSGNDEVVLPVGIKYFINASDKGQNCKDHNMKMKITVPPSPPKKVEGARKLVQETN